MEGNWGAFASISDLSQDMDVETQSTKYYCDDKRKSDGRISVRASQDADPQVAATEKSFVRRDHVRGDLAAVVSYQLQEDACERRALEIP
jgi:hypothetical protein